MKQLLNTLYVTSEDAYLSLNGETVEVQFGDNSKKSIPLHNLESIVCFSYKGASPALMGKCASKSIQLSFFSPNGRYLASVNNSESGNVLLRRKQYRIADDESASVSISRAFISAKIYNSKYVLLRYLRDHRYQLDYEKVLSATNRLSNALNEVNRADSIDSVRGVEGNAAAAYYSVFDELILQNKERFRYSGRNKRPPTDSVNALLSFAYTLLSNECVSALYSVGLDPFVGFMHTDRPGRKSLSLDLMEELRPVVADRFVLSMINNRMLNPDDFIESETGSVRLTDDARKKFISEWQKKKTEKIVHPYLNEKINWGLVPYVQALLLSRYIRGDVGGYAPFFWK